MHLLEIYPLKNQYFVPAVVLFGQETTREGKKVLICGFLSHHTEAEGGGPVVFSPPVLEDSNYFEWLLS